MLNDAQYTIYKIRSHTPPGVFLARIYKGLKKYLINYYLYIMYAPKGGHYVNFVYCILCIVRACPTEHHQSKSSSSMPSSWATNLTARGGRSFRVGATPSAEICFRCASIHRRSSSVLMPAARAIWSLLFAFMVGRGFDAAKIRLFSYKTIYIYIYIYCWEKTQRNPTKPNETHVFPRKPTYPSLSPRKPTQSLCVWGRVSYLCIAIGVRALIFGLFPLGRP